MSFLTIVQPDETFPYTPTLADGAPSDSRLTLRVLSDVQLKALRKKHTKQEWAQGQRVTTTDAVAMADDLVDAAIVAWTGIRDTSGAELPCERTFKLLLPERVQADVVRLCAGKDAGSQGAAEGEVGGDEGKAPSPAISTGS